MKFTICFQRSGFLVEYIPQFWEQWLQRKEYHQLLISIYVANLVEKVTCLRPKRQAVSYHKNPSQVCWTQHHLTCTALLAGAETSVEWLSPLSLATGPQLSWWGEQADIGAPTPTNPTPPPHTLQFLLPRLHKGSIAQRSEWRKRRDRAWAGRPQITGWGQTG